MPSYPLLDIAIALVFIYLLLSLICSSLNEGLESFLRNRANDLEAGIRNVLGDNKRASWWASFLPWVNSIKAPGITRDFYTHPLIRNLFLDERKLPTYIPSRNFALAVMDMYSNNRDALPERLTKSVEILAKAAGNDVQLLRQNIENWFNSSMDRVSGGYKSRTQLILFSIGILVTCFINADTVNMFRTLSHSKNLQAIVGAAGSANLGNLQADQDTREEIKNAMGQLDALDIGVGWKAEKEQHVGLDPAKLPPSFDPKACLAETWPCNTVSWTVHLLYLHGIGWLITAAAISLGAPFWFDILNRFMVVRSTVKPAEKSHEEPSKDA